MTTKEQKQYSLIMWLFWCSLFHWRDYISLILCMYMYLVDPFYCIYMYKAVKKRNISCDFMAVYWSDPFRCDFMAVYWFDPLGFRDWINSAPPENILRLVTCLRILMREPEFQKVFYTIHGLQVLSEVSQTQPGKVTSIIIHRIVVITFMMSYWVKQALILEVFHSWKF